MFATRPGLARGTARPLHRAQSKSAVADLDNYYGWPNPRYCEVRLRAVPLPRYAGADDGGDCEDRAVTFPATTGWSHRERG
jgi:hypothetical protein